MLPEEAQKVLVSAVISNAEAVGEWLNGAESEIVVGTNLIPTFKSVGFASWLDQLGRIEYISNEDAEKSEFFVPRVIESFELQRKRGESKTKLRKFPNKSNNKDVGKEIALYLGFKLIPEGAVAIFCGRKDTASSLCEMAADRFSRNLPMPKPSESSDSNEILKLNYIYEQNLGIEASATKGAQLGIFSHHGNIPHGIRLAVEYAMREGLISFVICTSTLAQGVNLPIRYLIVTSVYQGIERIKIRDFHNLIGRVGRAGMHTEGSILFADPNVYDRRRKRGYNWRWKQVKELLEPNNSEPCISNLLSLFDPIKSDDERSHITMEPLEFAKDYLSDANIFMKYYEEIVKPYAKNGFTKSGVGLQISRKVSLISSIESFLLSHCEESGGAFTERDIVNLAEETLAYFLADELKQEHIRELFKLLAENISKNISDSKRRNIYGKTLYGVRDAQAIDEWFQANFDHLLSANTDDEILNVIWPLLIKHIHNGVFKKCNKPAVLREIVREWIHGRPFHELFGMLKKGNAKLIWGSKYREFKIDHTVDLCEKGLAYDGALLISALIEFIGLNEHKENGELIKSLELFQKKLKYGLPSEATIILYEFGFSDRMLAQELVTLLDGSDKKSIKIFLRNKQAEVLDMLNKYPSYFLTEIYNKLV